MLLSKARLPSSLFLHPGFFSLAVFALTMRDPGSQDLSFITNPGRWTVECQSSFGPTPFGNHLCFAGTLFESNSERSQCAVLGSTVEPRPIAKPISLESVVHVDTQLPMSPSSKVWVRTLKP